MLIQDYLDICDPVLTFDRFMANGYISLRELEDQCKVNLRFEEDFFSKFCEFLVWNLSPLGIHRKLIPADQVRYPYKLISFVL